MSDILSRILTGVLGGGGGGGGLGGMLGGGRDPRGYDDAGMAGGIGDSPLGTPRLPSDMGRGGGGGPFGGGMGGGGMGGGGLGGLGGILGGLLGGLGGGGGQPMPQQAPSQGGLGGLAASLGGIKGAALMALLAYMMRGQGGQRGFSSLTDQLRGAGLGPQVDSWIASGPNQEVTPRELSRAIPPEALEEVSSRTGIGQDEILSQMSRGLPQMVDRLTPHGRMPMHDDDLPRDEPDDLMGGFGMKRFT